MLRLVFSFDSIYFLVCTSQTFFFFKRVGHLFEVYVLPLIQSDHEKVCFSCIFDIFFPFPSVFLAHKKTKTEKENLCLNQ